MQVISEMAPPCSFVFFFCSGPLSKTALDRSHKAAGFPGQTGAIKQPATYCYWLQKSYDFSLSS
jgi:hypothetical protein